MKEDNPRKKVKTKVQDNELDEETSLKVEGERSGATSTVAEATEDMKCKIDPHDISAMNNILEEGILTLCAKRGASKTCCPSEVARKVDPNRWRELMEPVRDAARSLAVQGKIYICQRNEVIDPTLQWTGPIRLRIALGDTDGGNPS